MYNCVILINAVFSCGTIICHMVNLSFEEYSTLS